jgi:hypothetical protein
MNHCAARAFAEAVDPDRCGVVLPGGARLSGVHPGNIERSPVIGVTEHTFV